MFIGLDGGGTSCRARIEDHNGRYLGSGVAGAATTRLGVESSLAAMTKASLAAAQDAGLGPDALASMHAGAGLAGFGRQGIQEQLGAARHPFRSLVFASDAWIACLGAHDGQDGGIVIAGTGSIAFAIVNGREHRIGGYGFPISDEGSGAHLGLKAVQMALRGHDGRHERTALLAEVMQRFEGDPMAAVAWMDRASATDYAALAPMVMRHADQGDPAGRRIVQNAAEQIDTLVRVLFEKGAPRVTLLGGLASPLEPWLSPDVRRRLKPADGDAVSGAIILAKRSPRLL